MAWHHLTIYQINGNIIGNYNKLIPYFINDYIDYQNYEMNYNWNHISYHNGPYDRLSTTSLTLFARLKFIKKKKLKDCWRKKTDEPPLNYTFTDMHAY